jgi:hypothetical protein
MMKNFAEGKSSFSTRIRDKEVKITCSSKLQQKKLIKTLRFVFLTFLSEERRSRKN